MHGERMAERVRRDRLGQAGPAQGFPAGVVDGVAAEVAAPNAAREQPAARGPGAPPVVAEDLQQPRREHDVAVLAALALVDADDHAPAVDVGRSQADRLGDAQAGRVAGGQDGAVVDARHAVEELDDFPGAGDDGQLAGLPGGGQDRLHVPALLEGDAVQEAQGGDRDADRAGREFLFSGQEDLVGADVLGAGQVRGLAEVPGELGDLQDVGGLRVRGEVAHLHVLGHALAEKCQGKAPLRERMECAASSGSMIPHREPPGKRGGRSRGLAGRERASCGRRAVLSHGLPYRGAV